MRMNMKWLAAIGLILMLLFTVCAATAEVTETLEVTVSTLGTPPEKAETYTFRLTAEGDCPMPEGAKDGEDGKQYFDLAVPGTNNGTPVSASFPKMSYNRVGLYYYTVKQIPGKAEGVTYDASVYDVKVTVSNKEGGGFDIATAIRLQGSEKKVPITFVNIYPVEKTEKTIVKEWDDKDNQDGIRAKTLTAVLTDGKNEWKVTLNEKNKWTATVKNLDKYQENTRILITYTWKEPDPGKGYECTGSGTEGDVTTLTNYHEPEQTKVSVEKVWDDAEDQDGIRPKGNTQLRVTLLADGKEVQSVRLNEKNGWKATLTVDKYAAGKEITYTWAEKNPPTGYTLSGNATSGQVTTLTNTHETETTTATIIKEWDDAEDQDGKRPEALTAVLSDGTKVTLNAENNWRATVKNLPKYEKGKEIKYTWKEDSLPAGYKLTDSSTDGTITTITNTHEPSEIDITIRKIWDDREDQDGLRKPVTLVLTGSVGHEAVASYTWEVKDEETLEHTFTVPEYYEGKKITYTVNEKDVPDGYSKSIDNAAMTVTNTHDADTVELTLVKMWQDDGNRDGIRPENIIVKVLKNGKEEETVTMTGTGDSWTYKVTGLPRYTDDKENTYTITEVQVPGYTSEIKDFAMTNTHEPEKTSVTVKKVWDDDGNKAKKRSGQVKVRLRANGIEIRTVTLNSDNQWTATVSDLPVNEGGKKINYTWREDAVKDYELSKTETEMTESGPVTTLTNSLKKDSTPGEPDYGAPLGFSVFINIGDCIE